MLNLKNMKSSLVKLAPAMVLTAVMSVSMATPGLAGIENTKHNLTSAGPGTVKTSDAGVEICAFCHTPHGSDNSAAAPLWNKALPTAGSFTTYDNTFSSTIDSTVDLAGSISLACLSCHDGSGAIDNMINIPGSGGYNASGASAGYTGLTTMPAGVTNLGTDLTNDHPVGIKYAGAGGNSWAAVDDKFVADTNVKYDAAKGWWVETGGNTTRNSTDLVLYTRSSSPYVECATCHDPHSEEATFLRIANTGSAVCKACHNK